jgi:hypothetical protein
MIWKHLFWWALTMTCVVWYCTITVYVAVRGTFDIRRMLSGLQERNDSAKTEVAEANRAAGNNVNPPPSNHIPS